MPRPSRLRVALVGAAVTTSAIAGGCGGAIPLGPDALKPETFDLAYVRGEVLPALAYTVDFGGKVYIKSAQLKSIEPGRSTDPRIADDRSGNGGTGGSTRDSTTVSARMADVRIFEERSSSGAVVGINVDSSTVTVERRGDVVLVRRAHPDPARAFVDTGRFENGRLVIAIRDWITFGFHPANGATLMYNVIR